MIIKEKNTVNWERSLVLEVIRGVFSTSLVYESIYMISKDDLKELLEVMIELIVSILNEQIGVVQIKSCTSISILSQFDKLTPPPSISPLNSLLLSYESFVLWIQTVYEVVSTEPSNTNTNNIKNTNTTHSTYNNHSVTIVKDLMNSIGNQLFDTINRLFTEIFSINNQTTTIQTLEFFSKGIVIFSLLEFRNNLRFLLNILFEDVRGCDLSTNTHTNVNINNQNQNQNIAMLIIKMVLETCTSKSVSELLEDSMDQFVPFLNLIDQLQRHLQSQKIKPQEFDKILELASSFIESSPTITQKSFTFLIRAYCTAFNEIFSDSKAKTSDLLLILSTLRLLLSLNIERFFATDNCLHAWNLLFEDFGKALGSRDQLVRQSACDSAGLAVDLIIKTITPITLKTSALRLQARIMAPLEAMSKASPWPDVHRVLLDCLLKYVHVFGDSMSEESWSSAWTVLHESLSLSSRLLEDGHAILSQLPGDEILSKSTSLNAASILYRGAHEIVKVASSDFLKTIPTASLADFIDLIAKVGEINISGELNIPLNTVRYLWDISDFLCSNDNVLKSSDASNTDNVGLLFKLWTRVLDHLVHLSLDSRPELRNSSVQTLLRTINMNGEFLGLDPLKWSHVFNKILFKYFEEISTVKRCSKERDIVEIDLTSDSGFTHFTRDSVAKQWDETECAAMTGVSSVIISHFHKIFSKLPEFPLYWGKFLRILKGYALTKESGRMEVVFISVSSLLMLAQGLEGLEGNLELWREMWLIWSEIGGLNNSEDKEQQASEDRGGQDYFIQFTQDSLLKYLKIYPILLKFSSCKDANLFQSSLRILSRVLRTRTPSDPIRDGESPTEVQKFILSQVMSGLIGYFGEDKDNCIVADLIWEEMVVWLGLSLESYEKERFTLRDGRNDELISIGYPTIRSRQSTASSVSTHKSQTQTQSQTQSNRPTFIAMTSLLLEKVVEILKVMKSGSESSYLGIFKSIGRYMRLKYKCPSANTKKISLWKTSTETFISVTRAIIALNLITPSCFTVILEELRATLRADKVMFYRGISDDEAESDEKFDCQLLELIKADLIPTALARGEIGFIENAIELVLETGKITDLSECTREVIGGSTKTSTFARLSSSYSNTGNLRSHNHNTIVNTTPLTLDCFKYPSGVKALPMAVKEILSISAYKTLLELASFEYATGTLKNNENSRIVGQIALKMLMEHYEKHLRAFVIDRKILGGFPFSRLRDLELKVMTRGILKLKIPTKLEHELEQERESESEDLKESVDHLRELYPLIVKCIDLGFECESSRSILKLFRKILQIIGAREQEDDDDLESESDYDSDSEYEAEDPEEQEDPDDPNPNNLNEEDDNLNNLHHFQLEVGVNEKESDSLPSPSVSAMKTAQRRSVSEELLSHLSNEFRVMQFMEE